MNRRGFLRGALAAAIGSCVRWLPMPAAPRVSAQPMTLLEWARARDPNAMRDALVRVFSGEYEWH